MRDVTEIMQAFYVKHNDLVISEKRFHETLELDKELRELYKEWCDDMGVSERKGFRYYIENQEQDTIWDSMYPNREELEEYEFFS